MGRLEKIMYDKRFVEQVRILLTCLPVVAKETCFALKGGTAINLFFTNLPRLSVDIDLTYIPVENKKASTQGIQTALENIIKGLKNSIAGFSYMPGKDKEGVLKKYMVQHKRASIKIEPSFVLRGSLYPLQLWDSCEKVNEIFNIKLLDVPTLDRDEVYAGKICAALARQHPRDLYDMKILLETDKINDRMRKAFVIYLASNPKPIHEVLSPRLYDIQGAYENQFARMTDHEVKLADLLEIRDDLIKSVRDSLTLDERNFLYSIKSGSPNYHLMPFDNLEKWPGLQWKLFNISKMDPERAQQMSIKLKEVLEL